MMWIGWQSQADLIDFLFDARPEGWWHVDEDSVETRVLNLSRCAHGASGFTHPRALSIGHVALCLLDGLFELGCEFQFVFDNLVQPFADLSKLGLRKLA